MMLKESDKMKYMQPGVFAGLAHERVLLEAAGSKVIDLSVGSPDMAPSLDIREAVSQSAMLAWNYSYSLEDMPQMRDAVKSWYLARYGVNLDTDREIISLNGTMDALVHLYLAFTDPGDKVLIGDPYYPAQLTGARIAGCEPVFMPLRMENDFLPDLSAIPDEVADASRLILVSYPNNPTTAIAPDSFWDELIGFAAKHDILVVHDNAYSDITYDGITAKSFLEFDGAKDVGIELNSLSKTYSVPGIRAAFMVGNASAVSAFSKLKTNIDLGMPYTVQYAVNRHLQVEALCHRSIIGSDDIPLGDILRCLEENHRRGAALGDVHVIDGGLRVPVGRVYQLQGRHVGIVGHRVVGTEVLGFEVGTAQVRLEGIAVGIVEGTVD